VGEAVLAVAEVGPAQGGDFELGLLPGVAAGGGALDVAVGDIVGGHGACGGEWEGCLEEDVGLVPVDVVNDVDGVGVGVELEVLNELRGLPGAGDADDGAHGAVLDELDRVNVGDGGHVVEGAGVDVPGVVVLGEIVEGLELVAAGSAGEGLEVGLLVVEAGDAAGGGIDDYAEIGVLHCGAAGFEVGRKGLGSVGYVEDLIAEGGDVFCGDEDFVGVGLGVALGDE